MSLRAACERIAPAWPLDQLIAVNPWWPLTEQPLAVVSARLAALAGVRCVLPLSFYRQQTISSAALQQAADEAGLALTALQQAEEPPPEHWQSLAALHQQSTTFSWRDAIVDQISRCCALYWQRDGSLYQHWLLHSRDEKGLALLLDCPQLPSLLARLPGDADAMLALAEQDFVIAPDDATDLGHGWLLEINGWASAAAYQHWQAKLQGQDCRLLPELLAIRLAWDWLTLQLGGPALLRRWQRQPLAELYQAHYQQQQPLWAWQRALELDYQHQLADAFEQPAAPQQSPLLQAVFCIDVRSEPLRRALEAQHPAIETRGFAGFFGMPLGVASGHYQRPQLPGLLAPSLWLRDPRPQPRAPWLARLLGTPGSFGAVEATGLGYAAALLKASVWPSAPRSAFDKRLADLPEPLLLEDAEGPLDKGRQAALLASVLKALGLTAPAPLVLLVGHAASSCNNPHAGGLACGACGGQSGELNVRVLAQLANDGDLRALLASEHGIDLPESCRFVAALHDTTSDTLTPFAPVNDAVRRWLDDASRQCRQERALRLGESQPEKLLRRGHDWAQTRPEWGLADNACFIIAPRQRSRHLNLAGRAFLHDYQWQQDQDFSQLDGLLTAPMVVTHWINMQYNASVTDPARYGSGNKILHNPVANLGVLEGQGGDLRIGLPWQSVHDGQQLQHRPQRLCVVVAAPQQALQESVNRHQQVRQLVDNHWLTLLQLDDDGRLHRLYQNTFEEVTS